MPVVRLACALPAIVGRSLSQWDCTELARQVEHEGSVDAISSQSVQRILDRWQLKPWRSHLWLHPRSPRDAACIRATREIADRDGRPLLPTAGVLSLDEKTSRQPRPRRTPPRPARPRRPIQVEHESARAGAVQLFAAFETRTGQVSGRTFRRTRQVEYLTLLAHLDQPIPATITTMHLIADNVSVHHGKAVQRWLAAHPRFVPHCTPGHCSWMNQVEQWFGILQRKRLRHPTFADLAALAAAILQFIAEWNQVAHPCRWTATSFDTILAKAEAALPPEAERREAA